VVLIVRHTVGIRTRGNLFPGFSKWDFSPGTVELFEIEQLHAQFCPVNGVVSIAFKTRSIRGESTGSKMLEMTEGEEDPGTRPHVLFTAKTQFLSPRLNLANVCQSPPCSGATQTQCSCTSAQLASGKN